MPDLADSLREYVDALVEPLDMHDVMLRPATRQRRPTAWLVAAAVLLAAIGGYAVVRRDEPHVVRTVDIRRPPGRPKQIIGTDSDSRVAVFDSITGKLLRVLTDVEPGGGAVEAAPSFDGRYVYFTRGLGTCASAIDRINRRTGAIRRVVRLASDGLPASNPAVSPDGQTLAYVRSPCGPDQEGALHLLDLESGHDSRLPMGDRSIVGRMTWSPDGRHLAFVEATAGEMQPQVVVLDVGTARRVNDGRPLDLGSSYVGNAVVAYRSTQSLVVSLPDPDGGTQVIGIDPRTGARGAMLFHSPAFQMDGLSVSPDGGWILGVSSAGVEAWHRGVSVPIPMSANTYGLAWLP